MRQRGPAGVSSMLTPRSVSFVRMASARSNAFSSRAFVSQLKEKLDEFAGQFGSNLIRW